MVRATLVATYVVRKSYPSLPIRAQPALIISEENKRDPQKY